jgi:fatty-acyl-CoA synthase
MLKKVMNLGRLLSDAARLHRDEPGLIWGDRSWSWGQIDDRVNAMVAALRKLGVRKGDKILVQSRNNLEMFETGWVAFKLGAVWVPTNYRIAPAEIAYLGQSSEAKVMIYDKGFEAHGDAVRASDPALEIVIALGSPREGEFSYDKLIEQNRGAASYEEEVEYDDPLWYFYTSGTTGHPKAAMLSHGQIAFVVTNHLADLLPGLTHADRSLVLAPLSHGAGIHAIVNTARGAASVLPASEKLDPDEAWSLVARHRVGNMFTVPTIVKMLVEHEAVDRHDHSSLKHVIYAGAPMYRADQQYALKKLGKVLVQYYGMGEVTGNITVLPADMHEADDAHPKARVGSCGIPRTGMELAILDDSGRRLEPFETGEICVRGPAVFLGYFNNPSANEKAFKGGWFHTGDLGHVDKEGFLYITGRGSDMYISGGSNVYPREIEEALLTHPGVAEVAIVGVPDPQWGESGIAVVVKKRDVDVSGEALLKHLDTRIAKYKWPRKIVFWDALPKSAYGKIPKKTVRQQLVDRGEDRL